MKFKINKRKTQTLLAVALTAIFILTGCGAKSKYSAAALNEEYGMADKNEIVQETMANSDSAIPADGMIQSASSQNISEPSYADTRKLIRNVHLRFKVEGNLQNAVEKVKELLQAAGGYAEQNSSYFGDYSSKVNMVLRVPKGNSDSFIEELKNSYKLLGIDDSIEDVTLNYTDIKTRLDVKIKTRDKYMEYLDKAETIEEIMSIEGKIAGVTADIESFESQMRVLNNQIDYTTVYVNLESDEKQVEVSFGDRIAEQFKHFLENAGQVFFNMLEWSVYALIVLAFVIPIAVLAFKLFMKLIRYRSNKKDKKSEQQSK